LLVTDNDVYPGIIGFYADGYLIQVDPVTVSGKETYQFEVLPDASLLPPWFSIDDETFGLRFIFNTPPAVSAGDNLSILSQDQATTIINGSAFDDDPGDVLTYRWIEDGIEVQSTQAVGSNGEALLDLAGLTPLSTGIHQFLLEVSGGGPDAVTDSMELTVNNSPPDVATGGSITVQIGDDIVLNGTVADFDGDLLFYTWKEGENILYSGQVETGQGGDIVALSPYTIVGGWEIGFHTPWLEVQDGINTPVTALLEVNVVDTQAPSMAPVASPAILWPPNHKMKDVVVTLNASDNSGGDLSFSAEVSSSENADKDGDGHTIPDFTEPVIDEENGTISLQLRSERAGNGPGRVYTIRIEAEDSSGNITEAIVEVICPHNKKK